MVVVSDGLWRRQFGGRSDIVGSTLRLDGKPFTVIGVAPPDLTIPAGAEYWRPLIFSSDNLSDKQRGAQWVGAIARLKPGVTLEQTNSAMAIVARRLSEQYPNTNKDRVMTAMRLHDRIVRGIRPALLILLGAVTLVLLVACVNVANLLLARGNSRAREVAVRAADGRVSSSSFSSKASFWAPPALRRGSRSRAGPFARSWRWDRRAFHDSPKSASTGGS